MASRCLRWTSALLLWSSALARAGEVGPPPPLSVSQGQASASVLTVVQQLVAGAYRSLGLDLRYRSYPVRRGLVELDAGKMDADLGRYSPDLERDYRHIRVVRTPVVFLEVSLFARTQDAAFVRVDSWEKLWGSQLRVVGVCGARFVEARPLMVKFDCAATHAGALKMLQAGRADVLVGTRMTVWETLAELPAALAADMQEVAVLSNEPLYHYVHERNAAAIPALERFFAQARKTGLSERLMREAIGRMRRHSATAGDQSSSTRRFISSSSAAGSSPTEIQLLWSARKT